MQKLYYCILLSLADVTDAGATRALDAATPGARDADGQGQGPGRRNFMSCWLRWSDTNLADEFSRDHLFVVTYAWREFIKFKLEVLWGFS